MTSWKKWTNIFSDAKFFPIRRWRKKPIFVHRFGSQLMAKISKNHTTGDSFHIKGITTTTSQIFSWISPGHFLVIAMADRNFSKCFCSKKLFENVGIGWSFCFKRKTIELTTRNHEQSLSTEPDASQCGAGI